MATTTAASAAPTAAPGGAPVAKGQVQKAFQGPGAGGFFSQLLDWAAKLFGKLTVIKIVLPSFKIYFSLRPSKNSLRRAGVLNTFKNVAEKRGVSWRTDAASLESRGLDVWEAERAAITDSRVVTPSYYEAHGQGTLHSYDQGNACWPAAFDAPSAYMLVHLHHYPNLTPQESFDQIHDDMHAPGLARLPAASGPVTCLDIGCGVGTSTFALQTCLRKYGREKATILGVDLSTHFVAVAAHRNKSAPASPAVTFAHGDGSSLGAIGVADASFDYVTVSEVTHELPQGATRKLLAEIARVLKPGGVLAYLDLNPTQALRDNTVQALTERIALQNEPYYHEYLAFDMEAGMRAAGLTNLQPTWVNTAKNKTAIDCSLRILIATKA